uniref:Uncharacterized protein n=1 Tax=Cacopsylla melanoneura TaxID=428564 RepID=A0A8D9BVK3_9HEMI
MSFVFWRMSRIQNPSRIQIYQIIFRGLLTTGNFEKRSGKCPRYKDESNELAHLHPGNFTSFTFEIQTFKSFACSSLRIFFTSSKNLPFHIQFEQGEMFHKNAG